jgi:hypothetical protein
MYILIYLFICIFCFKYNVDFLFYSESFKYIGHRSVTMECNNSPPHKNYKEINPTSYKIKIPHIILCYRIDL